jgi:hypothetical protein
MRYFFIPFTLFLSSCSSPSDIKVNYESENIFDLEISAKKILYLCSTPGVPKEPRTFFSIYTLSNQGVDLFFTRRALELSECKEWIKEVDQIMKGANFARVVGLSGSKETTIHEDLRKKTNNQYSKTRSMWYFSRIVTDKGCVGHFGGECEPGFTEKKNFINP